MPFDRAWQTPFNVLLLAHVVFAVAAVLVFNNVKRLI